MKRFNTADCELVYEAQIQFTGIVDYGIGMQDLATGKMAIPLTGARFDQTFEGQLDGPKLSGKIRGTDFLYVRPDGLFQLHLHAHVCTDDGVNIAFSSTGVSLQSSVKEFAKICSAVSLFTADEAYHWVNGLQLWALGSLDLIQGTASIRAYAP